MASQNSPTAQLETIWLTQKKECRRFAVSWELVRSLLKQDNVIASAKVVADGIPQDAELVHISYDGFTIWMTLRSKEFEATASIEILDTKFERVNGNAS